MSHKLSRRAVLFEQLAKDEKFKDAFKLIATSLVNNPELSSLSLADYSYSDDSDEDVSEDDVLDEEVSDDDEPPELCSDCKCGKKVVNAKAGMKTINKCQQKTSNKSEETESILKKLKQKMSPIVFEDFYDSDDNDEGSDCDDCQQSQMNGQKSDELTEEEKRKRRNEKKRLQKKKKRDKRKAEKQSNIGNTEVNGATKSEANKTNDNKNNNNKNNNKKLENSNKPETNSNTKNKHKIETKNETKTAVKPKEKQNDDKTDPKHKNKDMELKTNSKSDQMSNGRNSRESQSLKSSPKSDRESDNLQSDVEEEELLLSSAYVAQIAQRKNKPTVYQKTAQTQQNEAQDIVEEYGVAKPKIFSDNNSNISNNCDFVIKNNSSQNNPNNSNQNKSVLSNNSQEVDDFPKYKQYFFEKPKPSKATAAQLTKEEKTLNVEKSVELAILANHRAENNQFVDAIDLFSQAIAYNSKDYRFYVNRSYCYDSIQDYRNALKDAEIAIKLKSDWPKCHYRKGKALAGLKNYAESEIALKKVLTLESDCVEAIQDLRQVRYSAIVDMGYDISTAELYSSNYESIKDALNALSLRQEKQKSLTTLNGNKTANVIKKGNNWWNSANNYKTFGSENGTRAGQTWDDDDIYISDDEFNSVREPTFEETSPTNPFGWKALWVGNVSLNAKLDTVTNMFRKFGNLNYCNIFKGNNGGNFILVHYDNSDSPTLAMSKYQGKVIPGVSIADTPLTIRFRPNKDQKKPNYDQRLESDECYYWRTTGCARGDNCLYKHIQANKGVDKQAWMCNPLRKNAFQKPQK